MLPQKLIDKVLHDYAKTKSAPITAKRAGLGVTSVYRILEAHGVPRDGLALFRRRARKLPPFDVIRAEYERGDSLGEIAERYKCTESAVGNSLKRCGMKLRPRGNHEKKITREEAHKMAALYEDLRSQQAVAIALGTGQGRVSQGLRMIGVHCGKDHLRGSRHPTWKGGRVITGGYVRLRLEPDDPLQCMALSNGYALEHRIVMARAIGRPLSSRESVHHINGNTTDNRLSNLQLRFGKHGKGVVMTCARCGSHEVGYSAIATVE